MLVINRSTYPYRACICTGLNASGKSIVKKILFPSFEKTNQKTFVSDDDFELLVAHANFKYRLDNGLLIVEGKIIDKSEDKVDKKSEGKKASNKKSNKKDVEIESVADVDNIIDEVM